MPKGQNTATKGFAKDLFTKEAGAEEVKPAEGFVSENEPKNREMRKKYMVGIGMTEEAVLRLDKQGAILVFEQKEAFMDLSDETVAALSRENRFRFESAKEFHNAWRGNEHAEIVEKFQVDPNMQGSAMDKLQMKGPPDMVTRWVAPYNVEKYASMGYKILSPDEVKTFLGSKGGHHEIGKLGQTELVAMGIPKELYDRRQNKKVEQNNEKAGAWQTSGLSELNRSGAQGFVASENDKRPWHTLEGGGSE